MTENFSWASLFRIEHDFTQSSTLFPMNLFSLYSYCVQLEISMLFTIYMVQFYAIQSNSI